MGSSLFNVLSLLLLSALSVLAKRPQDNGTDIRTTCSHATGCRHKRGMANCTILRVRDRHNHKRCASLVAPITNSSRFVCVCVFFVFVFVSVLLVMLCYVMLCYVMLCYVMFVLFYFVCFILFVLFCNMELRNICFFVYQETSGSISFSWVRAQNPCYVYCWAFVSGLYFQDIFMQ